MKYKKVIILVVVIVFLGLLGAYNKGMFTRSEPINVDVGEGLTIDDYDKKDETLKRLGFASVKEFNEFSDGSETKDEQIETLQSVFEMLDTVERESDMVDVVLSIGLYLNLFGETDKAIEQYEYLLIKRPTHSTVMNNLAWIYIDREEYEKAEGYFKTNIENNPAFSNWYINLADLYRSYMPEKKSEIPELIQQGIDEKEENFVLTVYLAEFYEKEKEYEKALEWYNKALAIDPDSKYTQQAIDFIETKMSQ